MGLLMDNCQQKKSLMVIQKLLETVNKKNKIKKIKANEKNHQVSHQIVHLVVHQAARQVVAKKDKWKIRIKNINKAAEYK